jgi:3-isopropylmalate/(R)-2-methylmalate dehydratase small subunit
LPAVECPEAAEAAQDGSDIWLDLDAGIATVQGKNFRFAAFPESLKQLLDAGGLIPYIAKYVLPQQRAAKG